MNTFILFKLIINQYKIKNTFKAIAASSCVAFNISIALTLKIRSPGSNMPFWSAGLPGAM